MRDVPYTTPPSRYDVTPLVCERYYVSTDLGRLLDTHKWLICTMDALVVEHTLGS